MELLSGQIFSLYSNTNKKLLIKQTCNYLAVLNKNQKSLSFQEVCLFNAPGKFTTTVYGCIWLTTINNILEIQVGIPVHWMIWNVHFIDLLYIPILE